MERPKLGTINRITLIAALSLGLGACTNEAKGNSEVTIRAEVPGIMLEATGTPEPTSTSSPEPTFTPTQEPTATTIPIVVPTAEPIRVPTRVLVSDQRVPESAPIGAQSVLINEINRIREQRGVGRLSIDTFLMEVAYLKSNDMADRLYFSHADPQGRQLYVDQILRNCNNPLVGANWAAENLGRTNDPNSISRVIATWMASPDHAHNLVDPNWRTIGVGMAAGSDGQTYFTLLAAKGFCRI